MDYFYHPEMRNHSQQITLSAIESQHIARVLRKKEGDLIQLINGEGGTAKGKLLSVDTKGCLVHILEFEQRTPLPYSLHIAIAPTKSNDRFEWFLEKATEIGVSEITPILCQNSERRNIKWDRYEKIILSAIKQSQQVFKPKLNQLVSYRDFIQKNPNSKIAHCREGNKTPLHTVPIENSKMTLLIGPEGDFTHEEIALAATTNGTPISLGKQRFRTETAGIVACHTIALRFDAGIDID